MSIQTFELRRHLAIARRHVEQADHGDDGGVCRAQQQEHKNNPDNPAERLPEPHTKGGASKLFAHEAKHVFVPLQEGGRDFTLRGQSQCFVQH